MAKGKAKNHVKKDSVVLDDGDQGSVAYRIWEIACKLRGIGELIKFRGGEPGLNEEDVNYGIGEIITNIADELSSLEKVLREDLW